jgi:hypothetical protein
MDNFNRLVQGFNRLLAKQSGGKIKKEEQVEVSKEDFVQKIKTLQQQRWQQTQEQ